MVLIVRQNCQNSINHIFTFAQYIKSITTVYIHKQFVENLVSTGVELVPIQSALIANMLGCGWPSSSKTPRPAPFRKLQKTAEKWQKKKKKNSNFYSRKAFT
ncbi:hypothetical protein GDO78_020561 [Eleutherodactylus coqui]|uniref:Uncharacterized protein n=1 Tax=Eleutherodactylus coqui TaxID=57060 RepID=A0A8J6EI57_ELECQ|nr:hypothetical protein GDO78_020561 [Eleutherodactylus coqui]